MFHILFALGSRDTRAPVRLPVFCRFIYTIVFAFRVPTSSGDIFAVQSEHLSRVFCHCLV